MKQTAAISKSLFKQEKLDLVQQKPGAHLVETKKEIKPKREVPEKSKMADKKTVVENKENTATAAKSTIASKSKTVKNGATATVISVLV